MKHKILIVEDDVVISEDIYSILTDLGYEVQDICTSFEETINSVKKTKPDLVLLDIRMNGKDEGIVIANQLRKMNISFAFITSFSDKTTLQNAIYSQPIGYILKPYTQEDITNLVNNYFLDTSKSYLKIRSANGFTKIKYSDIIWVKSDNVYLEVNTVNDKHIIRNSISTFFDGLPKNIFFKVHRSFIVNKNYISSFNGKFVVVNNNRIPIAQSKKEAFLRFIH